MGDRRPEYQQQEIEWPAETEEHSDASASRSRVQKHAAAPDQPHRDLILNGLEQTLLVEAAAGTGKTTCLIGRMVNLLRGGHCQVSTLAAVTFTRKAAAELRTRFQLALEDAAVDAATEAERRNLQAAIADVQQCFIGTIHSFCGRLLRERPFEAGVDPDFTELDETQDKLLRQHVWRQYVATLIANNDPILPELEDLGLRLTPETDLSDTIASELDEIGLDAVELGPAFLDFAEYPDVATWPAAVVPMPDVTAAREALTEFVAHMRNVDCPAESSRDRLGPKYREISRAFEHASIDQLPELMQVLERFREFDRQKLVQRDWPGKKVQALHELEVWNEFFRDHAGPLKQAWAEHRYEPCLRAIKPARDLYRARRREANSLNFHDLLLLSVALLRDQPAIRRYFRQRFTHLLVDEFQDTDPIQAEVMMLLTAADASQTDWQQCRPVPGSLFVVGDPKQSIYRFRRADIQTYNKVRRIIEDSCGQVVQLSANFRGVKPIITFVNKAFDRAFPSAADDFSPANCHLDAGRREIAEQPSIHKLLIPQAHRYPRQIASVDAEVIARTIRSAIDGNTAWQIPRTAAELANNLSTSPVPSDFLIIARNTTYLSMYADALQRYGLPHVVTGGTSLNQVPELRLLHLVLRAITRSEDPIALLAVLRSELFGVPDTSLYAFKVANGRFSWQSAVPEDLPTDEAQVIAPAFGKLKLYAQWLDRHPAGAAIERIAGDLGLLARAAAADDGGLRAGSLMKAVDLLRSGSYTVTSGDIVTALGRLVDYTEKHGGMTVRSPAQQPIRVMNLHQCKGLEAHVVFLAMPTGDHDHPIRNHIDRADREPRGYLPIYGPVPAKHSPRSLLAKPQHWDAFASHEQRFLEAEEHRLLYVAATRACARLIVSQRAGKNDSSPWRFLDCDMEKIPVLPEPGPLASANVASAAIVPAISAGDLTDLDQRWTAARSATYDVQAVKNMTVTGESKPHGTELQAAEWGTVLHALLESAMKLPDRKLKSLAVSALIKEGLPADLLDELLTTVARVTASDLWKRAESSEPCLTEVPLNTLTTEHNLPTVLRGVIDLVFREPAGWVIVDYKSERVAAAKQPALTDHYRPQVEAYAKLWADLTSEPVVERGIFYTHTGEYVLL